MSFIAITYGYNMFSIFNTTTTTLPLIDNIKTICFDDLSSSLIRRLDSLNKEINNMKTDSENLQKLLKSHQDKRDEELKKIEEMNKTNEELRKDPKGKAPAKGAAKPAEKKPAPKKGEVDNSPIGLIEADIKNTETKIATLTTNFKIMNDKLIKLQENVEKYKKVQEKAKAGIEIDLTDINGERVNLKSKENIYANQYLVDRQPYELNVVSLNDKNEQVLESLKIDGFCCRTIEEDIKFEENEKNNKGKKPPPKKK